MPRDESTVRIGGRRLRISNLDKVMYPETGTTKGEVIDYYARIAPAMLPWIAGRPVTRKRWPDGVGTEEHPADWFFAKDLEAGAPDWLARLPIDHSSGAKDYPVVDDVASLVYLAQVASLEIHVPQWRFDAHGGRSNPDRMVLDLDPGPGVGLVECAEVARRARGILQDMGLDPVPVTSGSKGIHLYAALPGKQTSDQVSAVARELARALEADDPALVVSQMAKSIRPGRVFLDWSQNNGSKTTIAPYSLRGRPHPTVAAPRTWEELHDPDLRHLTFDEVLTRAASAPPDASAPLQTYIDKRSADRTPEPVPDSPRAAPTAVGGLPRFVIQEHHARRLHWDFRLERDGVLVSWAVPKGVPPDGSRNSLAVMTEDHPLDYGSFEGEIPHGEYGAGSVTIWDDGVYELEKWRDSEVIATLDGRPGGPLGGRARVALIRTGGEGEKSTWLLHRMALEDEPAPHPARPDPEPTARPATSRPAVAPMLATAATPAQARNAVRRWGDAEPWVEAKWDGIRALGIWDGERLRLRARSGADITEKYPELTGGDLDLGPDPAVLDGEIVALDATGRPSFTRLQSRMNLTRSSEIAREAPRTPVQWYLFDVLSWGGADATDLPLAQRRGILERIPVHAPVVIPPVFDDLEAALSASRALGLEGVVVKDPRSRYRSGSRGEEWLKVKHTRTQEVVIGGIRPGRRPIASLLLGIPGQDGLRYAGRVGTGFTERDIERLQSLLTPLRTDVSPFVTVPAADASDALWVRPELVGEVEYAELTPGGILRHSRWRGLRPDKSPGEIVREDDSPA